VSSREDGVIVTAVTLSRGDVADASVSVLIVVPRHEFSCPGVGSVEIVEALRRELGAVLGGAEQRLGVGVVVTHAGPRARRRNPFSIFTLPVAVWWPFCQVKMWLA